MRQAICGNKSWKFSASTSCISKRQQIQVEPQSNEISNKSIETRKKRSILLHYLFGFHRRYWARTSNNTKSYDLFVLRILAILIWLYVIIIEFFAYSNIMKPTMITLNFLFGSCYSLKDVSSIIYGSGAAVYGVSIEIYFILPFVIVNCILAITNCGVNHRVTIASIVYIVKTVALFAGTELSYQNFKRFTFQQSYKKNYQTASRAMLRQSIYLTVTIIFLVSPGLRSISNTVRFRCPYSNTTITESDCTVIDIERPVVDDHFLCVGDYTAMITGMEQLRIIRDITLCSIAFYSMYNKAFLDITGTTSIPHKTMLFLFFAMSCSILAVNIDPLYFTKIKLYFNLIEILIFFNLMVLLILSLQPKYAHKECMIMQENPTIFG